MQKNKTFHSCVETALLSLFYDVIAVVSVATIVFNFVIDPCKIIQIRSFLRIEFSVQKSISANELNSIIIELVK